MVKNVIAEVAFPILLPVKEQRLSQLREKKEKEKAVFSKIRIYSEIHIPLVVILIL